MRAVDRSIPLRLALAALGALTVAADLHRAVPGDWLLVAGALAAVAGAAIGVVSARSRWPSSVAALAVAGSVVVITAVVASSSRRPYAVPAPAALRDAASALVRGWSQVLSAAVPLSRERSTAAVALLIIAVAAWGASEAVVRSDNPLLPALFQVPSFFLAEMVAAPSRYRVLPGLAFGLIVVLGIVARASLRRQPGQADGATPAMAPRQTPAAIPSWLRVPTGAAKTGSGGPGDRRAPLVRALSGLVVLAIAAPAATAAVGWVAAARMRHPFDPRDVREPTVTQETLVHPLSRLQAELAAPPRDVLELRTDQPPVASGSGEPVRLRLVALDTYDGSAWQVPSVLTRALGGLPRSSSAGTGTPVDERITLHQLDSPWLPSLGWPASVRMDGSGRVGFDAESGNLLSGTSGGANGASYQLTATVSHLGPEQLRSATASAFDARYVRLPNGASQLPGNLSTALAASGSGYDRLNALADRLRGGYAYDPSNAPSGHSLGQLRRFLSGDVPGSAEQFATVFALTARQLGYPSRVVIGYRADVGRLENGRVLAVSSKDLHAWPEIHFDGIGWVPFEPTPDTAHAVPPPPAAPQTSLSGAALGAAAPQQPLDQSRLDRNSQREKRPALVLWQRVGLGVLAVLAVIGLVASGPPAAKAARRARRRRGTPTAQVLGAWAEARDRLREHGLSFAVGSTASEVAKAAEGSIGPDAVHLGTLAPLVATAVYRPEGATPESPALAWAAVGHLRRGLNRRAGSLGRMRAALDPRPLRRRGATPVKDSTPAKDNPQAKEKLS